MPYTKVAKTSELPPGESKQVELNGKKIAIFNVDGALFAMEDNCNHKGGPLSEGILDGKLVTCPWHGARFDVTSGAPAGGPANGPLPTFPIRVQGDEIEVDA